MATAQISILALGLTLVVAGSAWAAPGYYVTELAGLSYTYPPTATTNADGQSLLSNGTVIGETISQTATSGGIADCFLSSWNGSGNRTDVYFTFNLVSNVWGDDGGQFVANQGGTVYVLERNHVRDNRQFQSERDFALRREWRRIGVRRKRRFHPVLGLRPRHGQILQLRPRHE